MLGGLLYTELRWPAGHGLRNGGGWVGSIPIQIQQVAFSGDPTDCQQPISDKPDFAGYIYIYMYIYIGPVYIYIYLYTPHPPPGPAIFSHTRCLSTGGQSVGRKVDASGVSI